MLALITMRKKKKRIEWEKRGGIANYKGNKCFSSRESFQAQGLFHFNELEKRLFFLKGCSIFSFFLFFLSLSLSLSPIYLFLLFPFGPRNAR